MRLPRAVRDATRPYVGRIPIPILSGPNRGRWWSLASAGHGFGSGRRELSRIRLIERLIRPDDCVWDVGAHHGYVTLCAARRVREAKQVHAFEPSLRNHRTLIQHLAWNHITDVWSHRLALSDFDGVATFGGTGTSQTFALDRGPELVEVRRGASLIESGVALAPTFLKIDVEGAESGVLRGLDDRLPAHARLLIAMHSRCDFEACRALLVARGFTLVASAGLVSALERTWVGDPDLLALGPESRTLPAERCAIGDLVSRALLP